MSITAEQTACFEAGIKFGSLYHQFAGTPVSPRSAMALSRAIESAIENQPYCTSVTVDMDTEAIAADAIHGYTELTGRYLEVELTVEYEDIEVTATMSLDENDYPRMDLTTINHL
jgi:hypothetical protein